MGGKCFPNVSRILKEDIDPTIVNLELLVGISFKNRCLGSVGKKPTSGDIDLAIDNSVDVNVLSATLQERLGTENVRRVGKLLTCSFPVANKASNVQIDFLQGDVNWLKLLYHSSSNSQYTGAHRNGVIRAILRVRNCNYSYDNNELIKKEKYTWSPTKGLCFVNQTRKLLKSGYAKTWTTDIVSVVPITEIPATIFSSKSATVSDLDSVETLITAINNYYNAAEDIYKEIAIEFNSMSFDTKYRYPECISKHIGTS